MRWPPLGNSPSAERTNRFEFGINASIRHRLLVRAVICRPWSVDKMRNCDKDIATLC